MSKKFELNNIGLDLRNTKDFLHEAALEGVGDIDYILLDLLSSKDPLTYNFSLKAVINGAQLYLEIDLEDFSTFNDPWEEAYRVYKAWEGSYWSLPVQPPRILFKNLPENIKPGTIPQGLTLFRDFEVGLEITDFNEWLKQIENWISYFDKAPEIVARSISPLHYNLDLEKWFELSQSEKIGLDWHGGYFSRDLEIETFGKSYLLGFAALKSSTVFLPIYHDFLIEGSQQLGFLKELKRREITEAEEKKFILKKSVDRLKKDPKKIVFESMKLPIAGKTWIIPSEDSVLFPYSDTAFSFSKPRRETYPFEPEPTELEFAIMNAIDFSLGQDRSKFNNKVGWRLVNLAVVDKLKELYPPTERWEMDTVPVGNQSLAISLMKIHKKKWWEKYTPETIDEVKDFFLTMEEPGKINFIDLDEVGAEIPKKEDENG